MASTPAVVFSRTLSEVSKPGAVLHQGDAVDEVRALRNDGPDLRTVGSLSLVRQLIHADLVDRLRLLVFPLTVGETGREGAFAGLPDVGLELVEQSLLDGRIVLPDYRPSGAPPYAD